MTSSTGCSGLTVSGSPPSRTMPSRIAARSTTAGTPVKSCSSTRAGVNAISFWAFDVTSQPASAWMSSGSTNRRVLAAQQVLEQDLERERQARQRGETGLLERRQAEDLKRLCRRRSARSAFRTNCSSPSFDHSPQRRRVQARTSSVSIMDVISAARQELAHDLRRVAPLGVDGVIHRPHVRDRDGPPSGASALPDRGMREQRRARARPARRRTAESTAGCPRA